MPTEMTAAEAEKYGDSLSIWQQIALLQAWSPLVGYAQRFVAATDPYAKAVIVAEASEWVASKTKSTTDDELVAKIADLLKTKEGEALVRWCLAKVGGTP